MAVNFDDVVAIKVTLCYCRLMKSIGPPDLMVGFS